VRGEVCPESFKIQRSRTIPRGFVLPRCKKWRMASTRMIHMMYRRPQDHRSLTHLSSYTGDPSKRPERLPRTLQSSDTQVQPVCSFCPKRVTNPPATELATADQVSRTTCTATFARHAASLSISLFLVDYRHKTIETNCWLG
jgi:hypothetical protein